MILNNKTFYPTPDPLIDRMIAKIQGKPLMILEPSAGAGAIIDRMTKKVDRYEPGWSVSHRFEAESISAIEIDPDLQATLLGKNIKVIDTDFLAYSGPDKFDLIIGNPPFDKGDQHLLKAIEILYRGEIVFLLNAETLRNPCNSIRQELAKKLKQLNADIEFISEAFKDADRPTGVEVALIYIHVDRQVEDDLFSGCDDTTRKEETPGIENNHEVSTRQSIVELVAEYNQVIRIGTSTIIDYYRNYPKIGKYIALNKTRDKYDPWSSRDMTTKMQGAVNDLLKVARIDFWRRTLDLPEVTKRMTAKKQEEFEHQVKLRSNMDFTENNIRQFILNLIGSYKQTLTEATLEIFDLFTIRHCYSNGLYDENIHFFSGWKTNNAFRVGKRVVIPIYGSYGRPFNDHWQGAWKLSYDAGRKLSDICKVMNYFDGETEYVSIVQAVEAAFAQGQSRHIESTYFTIHCYRKGTIHLTFKDENILRRFNIAACLGKQWLPHNYGQKTYAEFDAEEKTVVDSFEGVESYCQHLNQPLFANKTTLKLAA